jgi:acetylornithine deacetylase/succinyl-diaminopimelate desuccinylase-like protein
MVRRFAAALVLLLGAAMAAPLARSQQTLAAASGLPASVGLGTLPADAQTWLADALGLMPFPLTEADEQRVHGDDERLPLAGFRTGVEFLYRVIYDFVAAK